MVEDNLSDENDLENKRMSKGYPSWNRFPFGFDNDSKLEFPTAEKIAEPCFTNNPVFDLYSKQRLKVNGRVSVYFPIAMTVYFSE